MHSVSLRFVGFNTLYKKFKILLSLTQLRESYKTSLQYGVKHFQLQDSCFLCQGGGSGSRELSLTRGLWSNLTKPLIELRQLDSE